MNDPLKAADAIPIRPVILSGGSGMRLWPLSRALYPKQLLPLNSDRTMLQDTVARVHDGPFAAPMVICNIAHRFIVAEQLRALDVAPHSILLEPTGRNTAPAVAAAALALTEREADALMLVLPSDHVVARPEAFVAAVETARRAAMNGALVTFGIRPETPETGYGYIRRGTGLAGVPGAFRVERFVEKPDRATAEAYLADGGYDWNSGMFLFRASRYLAELERLRPAMVTACRSALAEGLRDLDFFRLDAKAFTDCEASSIDYAVMEHAENAAVVPVDMGWNDVGSWSALWDIGTKDGDGNVLSGDVMVHDVRNAYIRADGALVAALGVEDVVIVATDDAVLVARRDRAQDVKAITQALKEQGRYEHSLHTTVYRPWGHYQTLDMGERFQVKQITVNPGARLSMQMHYHRAEHWVVVEGTAKVTAGERSILLCENQSTYIPLGVKHSLENPGKLPLRLVEVQSGSYLGEDDIVRFDDMYGRKVE